MMSMNYLCISRFTGLVLVTQEMPRILFRH